MSAPSTVVLRHVHVDLALHRLRDGEGRGLLLLHGLGERTPDAVPEHLGAWSGPVWGLDFTGHGASTVPAGGGYTAEVLMADVDHALGHIGEATLLGRGLGAYVALLIAGARPRSVVGAILTDGPGLAGGGPAPRSPSALRPVPAAGTAAAAAPDPFALAELSQDVRPADYATAYVRQALQFSGLETPIAVPAVVRPPWLAAVAAEHGVAGVTIADALRLYAGAVPAPPE
ncbi:MAG: mhpC [Acidimicrobiales bacterium]|nr:mhpC [Acidimicrobiales bacterium]